MGRFRIGRSNPTLVSIETDVGFGRIRRRFGETNVGLANPTLVWRNQRRFRESDVGFDRIRRWFGETDVGFEVGFAKPTSVSIETDITKIEFSTKFCSPEPI